MISPNAAVNAGVATGFNKGGKVGARAGFHVRLVIYHLRFERAARERRSLYPRRRPSVRFPPVPVISHLIAACAAFMVRWMHRLSRAEIETVIAVTLATAPPLVRSRLRSKLTTDKDGARDELARLITAKIHNDSSMIIVTELLGTIPYNRPGKWGVDETAPC